MSNNESRLPLVAPRYLVPFVLVTSLFFIWGFARATLDVLNKHFQDLLDITITRSSMIQATTYLGYFLMAIPAGLIITRWGYRRGVVTGLLLFGSGALMFIPAAAALSFDFFMLALFIIGCGLVILETAANPYITELGDRSTSASRLNLAQSFNGLGCIMAPFVVGSVLFGANSGTSVAIPYTVMGVVVLVVALVFTRVRLPEISDTEEKSGTKEISSMGLIRQLITHRRFTLGLSALFCYEIAEISINSFFINYATSDGWMTAQTAATVLSFGCLALFMLARIAGSSVMRIVPAERVLLICAIIAVLSSLCVTLDLGTISKISLFACYASEAIMFPTIFAITIRGLSSSATKMASAILMMTPLGGAVGTFAMGWTADATSSMSAAFSVPCIAYCIVLIYSRIITGQRFNNQ